MSKRRDDPEVLDMDTAAQMLNNVLDLCNYERPTVPMEVLMSYSRYRSERYALQKVLITVMLVLFLLLPLLFLTPGLQLTSGEDGRVTLKVDALLPVKSVSVRQNGRNVAVYDAGGDVYTMTPTANGDMEIRVSLVNGQVTSAVWSVKDVDTEAPVYVSSAVEGDMLRVFVSDSLSGVHAQGIRAALQDEETPVEVSWNAELGCVEMVYPTVFVSLYVPDNAGNTLHLLLTPR